MVVTEQLLASCLVCLILSVAWWAVGLPPGGAGPILVGAVSAFAGAWWRRRCGR
jgi:hypothetical protein